MISDLDKLIPLKQEILKNGFKNEYYKQRYEETKQFDKIQKEKKICCFRRGGFQNLQQHYYLRKRTILKNQMDKEIAKKL